MENNDQTTFINAKMDSIITLPCSSLSDVKPTWFLDDEMISFTRYKVHIHITIIIYGYILKYVYVKTS